MKMIKKKLVYRLVALSCSFYVLFKLYGLIHLRMQTAKNKNSVAAVKSNQLNRNGHENNGIQMSEDQIRGIRKVLPSNGNLLVWGLGNDSPYWHNSTDGKVIFIEDDSPSRKAGIQWYDEIMQKFPFLEAYRVHYNTHTVKSFLKYVNNPDTWHELDSSDQLPEAITRSHWHVIIVDAPLGCCGTGPGRYQSIYTSWKIAKIGTHIFVDDFERKVEHELSMNIFGKSQEVIKRQNTEFSKANEQAHFIVNPDNVFPINHAKVNIRNGIESDIIKGAVVDKTANGVYNWSLLLTVNNGFFDFFNNWRLHFITLNISLPVYVIAEDNIVYNKLTNIKNSGMKIQKSELISINTSVNYDSFLYKKMVSARPSYIMSFIQKGMDIIYSDIDSVWLKNPLPYLTGDFDIWSQMDLKSTNHFCTGFLAIQSNENTLSFIKKWQEALKETPKLNQPVFNNLLQKSSLHVKALNSNIFPSGKQYFEQFTAKERAGVAVVHNNWIIGHDKKLERFKKLKLWIIEK